MRIAIDASRSAKKFKTGVEYYSDQVILNLAKIDRENEYILFSPRDLGSEFANLPSNFKQVVIPFPRLWSQIRLSFETLKTKADVWYFPAHTIPILAPKNSVIAVHDLGFKYYPELYTPFERFYHNWCMNFSVKNSKKIVADSEYTKKDILKNYVLKPSKIEVIHLSYNDSIYKLPENEDNKPDIDTPYIFYVGRLERKKNIKNLIEAYGLLRSERKIKHKLILAGKPGYGYDEIKQTIQKQKKEVQEDIIELGYVADEDVARYMQFCDIFVFPSNFEGFGIPLLEAMACGAPVVATNLTCIPEITGDAALLTSPKPFDISAALSKLIHNRKLRDTLVKNGLKRVQEFSWELTARKTLESFKEAARK